MSEPLRRTLLVLVAAALATHVFAVGQAWMACHRDASGRDFASYYYAVRVAAEGGDPYTRADLREAVRKDSARKGVHPFFYPPPFVASTWWVQAFSLTTAYRVWFWLDELCAILSVLVLWWWWRPLGPAVPVVLAASLGALQAIPNNHLMGQANFPILLLVLLGLWQENRGRSWFGGALIGWACMLKMSPAFFVAWWMMRGRWRAVISAVGTAIALSVATLPFVGFSEQLHFYSGVLPGFSTGTYNGLTVGIDLYGNHSIPNLLHGIFPADGGSDFVLSGTVQFLSALTLVGLVAGTGWALRRPPADLLALAGHIGAVAAAMLLVPVFTYEHHLIWLLPVVVACGVALWRGRLRSVWAIPLAIAWVVWCYDLAELKTMHHYVREASPALAVSLRESKFVAIVVFYAASLVVARSVEREDGS